MMYWRKRLPHETLELPAVSFVAGTAVNATTVVYRRGAVVASSLLLRTDSRPTRDTDRRQWDNRVRQSRYRADRHADLAVISVLTWDLLGSSRCTKWTATNNCSCTTNSLEVQPKVLPKPSIHVHTCAHITLWKIIITVSTRHSALACNTKQVYGRSWPV